MAVAYHNLAVDVKVRVVSGAAAAAGRTVLGEWSFRPSDYRHDRAAPWA